MLHKDHKSKQASLIREKCKIDKDSVSLHSCLDSINMSFELLRSEQHYNINTAVNEAKQDEICHYSMVIQTQKDEGRKMHPPPSMTLWYVLCCI